MPNLVTLLRTVLAVVLGGYAIASADLGLLAVAYAVYWVGDIPDGWLARRLGQETRLGAVLDIVCDRACTGDALRRAGRVRARRCFPSSRFLLSFTVLDSMLSLAFLCWPILGPNDFHLVDRGVWQLNWSPLAKAANTAGVVGALALGWDAVAFAIAVAVLAVKIWSARRVLRLLPRRDGELAGRAALAAAVGVASALLPLVNAEAYALIAAARTHAAGAVIVVLALAAGQTVGKLVLFESARRGSGRLHARFSGRAEGRAARWRERVCGLMGRRRTGLPTVLASATLGLPPLALVSLAAGASGPAPVGVRRRSAWSAARPGSPCWRCPRSTPCADLARETCTWPRKVPRPSAHFPG